MFHRDNNLLILAAILVMLIISLACGGTTTVGGSAEATVANLTEPISNEITPPLTATDQKPISNTVSPAIPTFTPSIVPPTNTPTPSVPPLEVVAGRDYIRYGYLHIVGEVINNTDYWYDFVKVVATFYDSDGKVLGSDFTYIELDELPPHGKGVFVLSSDVGDAAASVVSYKLQVQGNQGASPPYTDLNVRVDREYSQYDYYHIVGEVTNTGDLDCEFTKIVAGFYDAEGNIIGADFTYAELDRIPAKGSSPFDLAMGDLDDGYDHIEVWVQCHPVR